MIFTTDKPLGEWGKALHDEDLTAAILDRILERGRFIHLDGPSWRTRQLNLEERCHAASIAQPDSARKFKDHYQELTSRGFEDSCK